MSGLFSDRDKSPIQAFVETLIAKYDYACLWSATVVSQNADGTLELKPDRTDKLLGLSSVPILYGMPGVTVTVQQGARCNVAFLNLDPQKPVVVGWESHDLVSMSFASGTAPIARVGDVVNIPLPASVPFAGTVGGAPASGTITLLAPAVGIIKSGASQVTG